MRVTENYSTQMYCPLARGNTGVAGTCQGARCMAWRWGDGGRYKFVKCSESSAITEPPRPREVPASWEWVSSEYDKHIGAHWKEPQAEYDARQYGYCGMVPSAR